MVLTSSIRPPAYILLSAYICASIACAQGDIIRLTNGDVLHGELVSLSPEGGAVWRHKYVKEPVVFSFDSVRRITVEPDARPATRGNMSVIRITNDDILHGRLVSLADNKLLVETAYAGQISIHRPMVSSIALVTTSDVVFEGPPGPGQWQVNSAAGWQQKENALYCLGSGYAGAKTGLPDTAAIEFTVRWKNSYPYFRFAFYSPSLQSYSSSSYSFRSSSSYVRLYRYGGSGSTSLPSHNHSGFAGRSETRFRLFTDKKTKRIILFMDDRKAVDWTEPQEWVGGGDSVVFYGYSGHPLKVTDFVVRKWDGTTLPGKTGEPQKANRDVLELLNGDKVTGILEGVTEGEISFKTSYASIKIPMQRVATIALSDETAERARRNRNDVKLHLGDTETITINLKQLAERRISGSSESYGDVAISMDSVVGIDLNIYDEPAAKPETDGDW